MRSCRNRSVMNNITECYKAAEKAVRDFFENINKDDFSAFKYVCFNDQDGVFFRCGYCHGIVNEKDHICKWCGKEFRK